MRKTESHDNTVEVSPIPVLIGAIIGLIAGYPLSYFTQPGALRMKCSLGDYIGHIGDILQSNEFAPTAIGTWIGSVAVFALLGLLVSFLANTKNDNPALQPPPASWTATTGTMPPSARWKEILGWLLLVSAVLVGLGMTIWAPI